MEWYEWLMYSLVVVLTVMRILEFFGVSFKFQFAIVSVEVEKFKNNNWRLSFFPKGKKELTFLNFTTSEDKQNNLIEQSGSMKITDSDYIDFFAHHPANSKNVYLHLLLQKPNGKQIKRTRNISKLIKNDIEKLRLKRIKVKV